jgi:hypothetical protein
MTLAGTKSGFQSFMGEDEGFSTGTITTEIHAMLCFFALKPVFQLALSMRERMSRGSIRSQPENGKSAHLGVGLLKIPASRTGDPAKSIIGFREG